MASLSTDKNGNRTIQFVADDGTRPKIRLGQCTKRIAAMVKRNVELIREAQVHGSTLDPEVVRWLGQIDDAAHERMSRVGLVEPREKTRRHTIRAVVDLFKEKRQDAKDSTRQVWKQAHESLVDLFGGSRMFDSLTEGDADDWRQHLIGRGLAETTIRKRTRTVNLLFNWAKRRKIVESNPFLHLPSTSIPGSQKPHLPREAAAKIIDKLPGAHWRLLFALGRYAGLRLPSEALALRWEHVDFEAGRICVQVPKLEHLPGKGERVIPIFADLEPLLVDAFEASEPGDARVVQIPDMTYNAIRKTVMKAARAAGVPVWTHAFNTLRASAENDLSRIHPAHVVYAWIGHDEKIARKHYLNPTDDDFEAARSGVGHIPGRNASEHTGTGAQRSGIAQTKTPSGSENRDGVDVNVGRGGLSKNDVRRCRATARRIAECGGGSDSGSRVDFEPLDRCELDIDPALRASIIDRMWGGAN